MKAALFIVLACSHLALALLRFISGVDPRYLVGDMSAALAWYVAA